MKVVLQDHVENLGERGDVVAVSAGYARNYLLPRKLALAANAASLRYVEEQRKLWQVRESREVAEAEAGAARLGALELEVLKKAGEAGTLYGSVTNSEIAELLAARGIEVDRRKLQLAAPIKSLGEYEIKLKLHPKVTASFRLRVVSEGGPPPIEEIVEPEEREDDDDDGDDEPRSRRPRRQAADRAAGKE
jgi:large subunit ribosomal protein L9